MRTAELIFPVFCKLAGPVSALSVISSRALLLLLLELLDAADSPTSQSVLIYSMTLHEN